MSSDRNLSEFSRSSEALSSTIRVWTNIVCEGIHIEKHFRYFYIAERQFAESILRDLFFYSLLEIILDYEVTKMQHATSHTYAKPVWGDYVTFLFSFEVDCYPEWYFSPVGRSQWPIRALPILALAYIGSLAKACIPR